MEAFILDDSRPVRATRRGLVCDVRAGARVIAVNDHMLRAGCMGVSTQSLTNRNVVCESKERIIGRFGSQTISTGVVNMNTPHIGSAVSSAAPFGDWWTPRLLRCAVVLALVLPGSFVFLPLIWLWQRWNGSRTL